MTGLLSPAFFPDRFLLGGNNSSFTYKPNRTHLFSLATSALEATVGKLSNPSIHSNLASVLGDQLLQEYEVAARELKSDLGVRPVILIDKVYDAYLKEVWVTIGPKNATDVLKSQGTLEGTNLEQHFFGTQYMNFLFTLPKEQGQPLLQYDISKGSQIAVDLNVRAKVLFELQKIKQEASLVPEVVFSDSCTRDVVVRFESPYFNSDTPIAVAGKDGKMEPYWHWRLVDIDYLVESKRLQQINRKQRD
jgi:hypothetical protein